MAITESSIGIINLFFILQPGTKRFGTHFSEHILSPPRKGRFTIEFWNYRFLKSFIFIINLHIRIAIQRYISQEGKYTCAPVKHILDPEQFGVLLDKVYRSPALCKDLMVDNIFQELDIILHPAD